MDQKSLSKLSWDKNGYCFGFRKTLMNGFDPLQKLTTVFAVIICIMVHAIACSPHNSISMHCKIHCCVHWQIAERGWKASLRGGGWAPQGSAQERSPPTTSISPGRRKSVKNGQSESEDGSEQTHISRTPSSKPFSKQTRPRPAMGEVHSPSEHSGGWNRVVLSND